MGQRTTTVSLTAPPAYKEAFKLLAAQSQRDMGDLVREALDEKFGERISDLITLFFADLDAQTHQSNHEGDAK